MEDIGSLCRVAELLRAQSRAGPPTCYSDSLSPLEVQSGFMSSSWLSNLVAFSPVLGCDTYDPSFLPPSCLLLA